MSVNQLCGIRFLRFHPIGASPGPLGVQFRAVNLKENAMRKTLALRLAAIPALVLAGLPAHAALPAEVTAAISTAGVDMVAAVTAIIIAFVAFWGLKKLAGKFGWI